jgi:hypothetical protein
MMNLTVWVDVAIGLVLVYLGASLLVTVINEYIVQMSNLRGRQLFNALKELIDDDTIRETLGKSPALKPFFDKKPGNAGSYVDPNVLGRLLVGSLRAGSSAGDAVNQVSESIDKMDESSLKTQLQALVRTAGNTTDNLVTVVSDWTDRSLTMLGDRYKRNLQTISFIVGLLVAISLNLNTVTLTRHLYRDKEAREAAVALSVQVTEKTGKEVFDKCMAMTSQQRRTDAACAPLAGLVETVQGRNESLGRLPIGWPALPAQPQPPLAWISEDTWLWGNRIVGWLLTALALSLGAPFWFDLLNKLVNVRHGMRKPEVKESKEDTK